MKQLKFNLFWKQLRFNIVGCISTLKLEFRLPGIPDRVNILQCAGFSGFKSVTLPPPPQSESIKSNDA